MRKFHLLFGAIGALWFTALLLGSVGGAQSITRYLPGVDTTLPDSALYAIHCLACHGPTGLGLDESRQRFPPDHQTCSRCHNPLNPPTLREIWAPNDLAVFSLGEPTPFSTPDYLARFPNLAALENYVRIAMPRWDPGKLTPEEAREVSLFVLHLSDSVPAELNDLFYASDLEELLDLNPVSVLLGN